MEHASSQCTSSRSTTANDKSRAGQFRAMRARTAAHAQNAADAEAKREKAIGGLSQKEWWSVHVRSREDVKTFYELFHPEFPDVLVHSIANRIGGIVDKSRAGESLTDEEIGYIQRSQEPSKQWDYLEDLKQQEIQAKLAMTIKRLEQL